MKLSGLQPPYSDQESNMYHRLSTLYAIQSLSETLAYKMGRRIRYNELVAKYSKVNYKIYGYSTDYTQVDFIGKCIFGHYLICEMHIRVDMKEIILKTYGEHRLWNETIHDYIKPIASLYHFKTHHEMVTDSPKRSKLK